MEKKKKHKKIATASDQEPESTDLLSKEEENQSNEALAAKDTNNGPSQHNLSSLNEQYSHIFQWPHATQQAAEQSSLNPRSFALSQSTLPTHASPSQQVAPLQPNSPNHEVHQGQPTVPIAQPTTPFWLPQRSGCHFPGVSVPVTFQPFTSIATIDASWPPPSIIGGTAPRSEHQVPNLCYHFGPYPGFPGPWDPSSWWAHGQQSQPSVNYTFPGAYGCFSSAPTPMPNCSAAIGEPSQRGIIRPMAKLSQKHQQLWRAQSIENVQLWSVIGQLKSEIADYKTRLIKLEAEVSSLKPSVDEPSAQVIRTGLSGAASKRGRPKRLVASVDVSASPEESHLRARVRKPAATKAQPEPRVIVFEKVALNKSEDRQKTAQSISSTQKDNGEKIPFLMTNSNVNLEVNRSNLSMPAFDNQVHQEGHGNQICGINSLETKTNGNKVDGSESTVLILSQQLKENNNKGTVSVTDMGAGTNGETLTWPASVQPEEPRRNIYHTISQGFYDNGCVIRQAGKLIPGWSFVNEEDATDELEVAVVASAKDENEEEMEDDASSGAAELAQTKDDSAYKMDAAVATNPKDLSQYNNW